MDFKLNGAYNCKDGNVIIFRSVLYGVPDSQYCIADLLKFDKGHYINKPITLSPKEIRALLGLKSNTKITII